MYVQTDNGGQHDVVREFPHADLGKGQALKVSATCY